MRFYYLKITTALLFFFVLVSGCTKNVPGPQGDPGEPGKNGNAKQTQVNSVSISSNTWLSEDGGWTAWIFTQDLSNEVIKSGDVEVYMQIDNVWWALPYAVGDVFTEFRIEQGRIVLRCFKIHDGPPAQPATRNFRVSILEPLN